MHWRVVISSVWGILKYSLVSHLSHWFILLLVVGVSWLEVLILTRVSHSLKALEFPWMMLIWIIFQRMMLNSMIFCFKSGIRLFGVEKSSFLIMIAFGILIMLISGVHLEILKLISSLNHWSIFTSSFRLKILINLWVIARLDLATSTQRIIEALILLQFSSLCAFMLNLIYSNITCSSWSLCTKEVFRFGIRVDFSLNWILTISN